MVKEANRTAMCKDGTLKANMDVMFDFNRQKHPFS